MSLSILRERVVQLNGIDWRLGAVDILEQWVIGEQNRVLASEIIYTSGKAPEHTADEIVDALGDTQK